MVRIGRIVKRFLKNSKNKNTSGPFVSAQWNRPRCALLLFVVPEADVVAGEAGWQRDR